MIFRICHLTHNLRVASNLTMPPKLQPVLFKKETPSIKDCSQNFGGGDLKTIIISAYYVFLVGRLPRLWTTLLVAYFFGGTQFFGTRLSNSWNHQWKKNTECISLIWVHLKTNLTWNLYINARLEKETTSLGSMWILGVYILSISPTISVKC